jgi:toxin YhaV
MEAYGWSLFAYPLFEAQLEKLANAVGKLSTDDPSRRDSHPATKLLVTIKHLVPDVIPRNPNSSEYRQGNTMGPDNRHWFRATFHGRYRLFFRFSTQQKIIVYAWVNDDASLRKAGSKTDPYRVFKTMLESGDPPTSFSDLLGASKKLAARKPRPQD